MTDDDLVLKLPSPPVKAPADGRRANLLSGIALIVSLASAAFGGLQWWEARRSAELARVDQGPYLEIEKAEFSNQSSLMITVRNIGRRPALKPTGQYDVYFGLPLQPSSSFRNAAVPLKGSTMAPSIAVGTDTQIGAYIPLEWMLKQYNPAYDRNMDLELRGHIVYGDDGGKLYQRTYCFTIHSPWGPGLPIAGPCVHAEDISLQ
jgi:hypothetical protein